jgi:hypothetical protein
MLRENASLSASSNPVISEFILATTLFMKQSVIEGK